MKTDPTPALSTTVDFPTADLFGITEQRMQELKVLSADYPFDVPVIKAAAILHTTPECLRASLEQGRCPFGYTWKLGDRVSYKIPTITFISWLTNGEVIRECQTVNNRFSSPRIKVTRGAV